MLPRQGYDGKLTATRQKNGKLTHKLQYERNTVHEWIRALNAAMLRKAYHLHNGHTQMRLGHHCWECPSSKR